jgi:small-conductance mechanosensitive channel
MSRLFMVVILAVTTAALWALHAISTEFNLFGMSALPRTLNALAWIASAALAVYVTAQLILQVILAELLEIEPSGLHRGLVVSLLTFLATAVVLGHFQFDISALLTTSAVLSLFVGFATRATLGSLIAGSTLGMDRVIRVGDGLIQGGQPVEIIALNWRSVTGRRPDGTTVLIPNAAIADNAMEVVPGDRPVRVESFVNVPAGVPPQRVSAIVDEVLGDISQLDLTQPIKIAPATFETDRGFLRYVIRYWVRHFAWRGAIENEVMRRMWYAFQREGIPCLGANLDDDLRRINEDALRKAVETALRRRTAAAARSMLAALAEQPKLGHLLLYAPGERITIPARIAAGTFLLVDGELTEAASDFRSAADEPPLPGDDAALTHLSRRVALQHIIERLAERIGPYAEHVVVREAARIVSLNELCEAVAGEIDDEQERAAFLRETQREEEETYKAGSVFGVSQDIAKNFVSKPPMRAVGGAAIVVMPAELPDAAGPKEAATAA